MKVEYVEESAVRKSLSFEIEPEVLEQEVEKHARDYARKLKLPGFRPGKIPLPVVKARFGKDLLHDAAEAVINRVVPAEISGRGLSPVGTPKVEDLQLDPAQPLKFRAVFETLPIIEVPDFKGLEVSEPSREVPEAEVDNELEQLRQKAARYEPIEGRAAQDGDYAVVDVKWSDGGPEKKQEGAMLHLGSPDHHPDINAALLGLTPGDGREVTVTYGADGPADLAGKTVHYKLTLKSLKQQVLPDLDDELAKDLGEFADLAALKADLRHRLEDRRNRSVDHEVEDALIDALIARSSFEVPEALIEQHMTSRTESTARGLAFSGIDPTKAGIDWKKYRDSQREASIRSAKAEILFDEIARREGIEALPAEVDAEISRLAEQAKTPKETVARRLQQDGGIESIRARIRTGKTLDLLKANARLARK